MDFSTKYLTKINQLQARPAFERRDKIRPFIKETKLIKYRQDQFLKEETKLDQFCGLLKIDGLYQLYQQYKKSIIY